MSKQLLFKDLDYWKEDLQDKLLTDLIKELDLEPSPESLHRLEGAIASFESTLRHNF